MSSIYEELYELIIDSADVGIIVLGKHGKVEFFNSFARNLLAVGDQQVNSFSELDIMRDSENDDFRDAMIQTIMDKQILKNSTLPLYVNGKTNIVSMSTSYIKKNEETYLLLVMNDITDMYELQNLKVTYEKIQKLNLELDEAKRNAEAANKEKSMFLSNMSHEIRTPINAILGMNEMILREFDDPELMEYASNIQASGKTLLSLINDILDFSKIESGKMELVQVEYHFKDILRELYQMISFRANSKDLKLVFDVNENIPDILYGDEVRVKQIITNVLTNAVKYTQQGSVTLIADYMQQDDDTIKLCISVKDTGIGIRKEDMQGLFEKFKRLDQQKNIHIEGTGLGMSITVSLLELMQGKLDIESEYGKGSTFTVTIPQKKVGTKTVGNFEQILHDVGQLKSTYGTFMAPDAKVLVVDDNVMNLKVIRGLLKCTRIQLTCVTSGKECLQVLEQSDFDLIFMDHMMPDMDGIETFHHLKKIGRESVQKIPVIILTANAISGMREMYLQEGFDDFLSKPIDSAKLDKMLCQYLPDEKLIFNTSDKEELNEKHEIPMAATDIEEILKIFGIDINAAMQYVNHDFSFYLELLTQYGNQENTRINQLRKYADEKNYHQYGVLAHAIKGDVRMLGAADTGEIAYAHEMAGKASEEEYIQSKVEELISAMEHLNQGFIRILELNNITETDTSESKMSISKDEFAEKIDVVISYLDDFEDKKGLELLENLMAYELEQDLHQMINDAINAIKKEYDGDKAIEILKKIRKGE